jgi:hypothetical protein
MVSGPFMTHVQGRPLTFEGKGCREYAEGAALRSSTGLLAGTPSSYLSTPTFPGIETIGDE